MKGQFASVLIVIALLIGVGIGYLADTSIPNTVTRTYTFTTTILHGAAPEVCTVVEYHVWSVETLVNGTTTVGGTSTQSYPVTTFQTSGYSTVTSTTYTGTLTGQLAYWNSTSCR